MELFFFLLSFQKFVVESFRNRALMIFYSLSLFCQKLYRPKITPLLDYKLGRSKKSSSPNRVDSFNRSFPNRFYWIKRVDFMHRLIQSNSSWALGNLIKCLIHKLIFRFRVLNMKFRKDNNNTSLKVCLENDWNSKANEFSFW